MPHDNYDHDHLGIGNSQHPANIAEIDSDEEKDLTIREALETGYEDKLLEAVGRQEQKEAHIYSELVMLRDYAWHNGNAFLKNKINKLLKTLE